MIRDLCVAFVAIYLFTHAVDFFNSTKLKYEKIKNEIPISLEKNDYKEEVRSKKVNKSTYDDNSNDAEVSKVEESDGVDKMVFIRALGYADDSDLNESAKAVTDYFGIKTEIMPKVDVDESMILNDSINGDIVINRFKNNTTKTIYVTNYPMTNYERMTLGGYTNNKSKVVLIYGNSGVRHLTAHEMGHTFGLYHCDNKECIMYYKYTHDVEKFCDHCIERLLSNYPSLN
jgi:hypothetical protein